ncbi:MAG: PaaI family thioesterase [Pseudomonadota bacterium]
MNDSAPGDQAITATSAMMDIVKNVPWSKELGFEMTRVEKGHAWGRQPYLDHLVGDPTTGIIHGGVITTMLDTISGMACASALSEVRMIATLDLRLDYMRPATPKRDIIGEAECFHITKSIAFIRAWAYHDSRDKTIAIAQSAFALTSLKRGAPA